MGQARLRGPREVRVKLARAKRVEEIRASAAKRQQDAAALTEEELEQRHKTNMQMAQMIGMVAATNPMALQSL